MVLKNRRHLTKSTKIQQDGSGLNFQNTIEIGENLVKAGDNSEVAGSTNLYQISAIW
jgi:hypothetical protein